MKRLIDWILLICMAILLFIAIFVWVAEDLTSGLNKLLERAVSKLSGLITE